MSLRTRAACRARIALALAALPASCSDPARPDVVAPDTGDDQDVTTDDAATDDTPTVDAADDGGIGPNGGRVDRFRFAVFGDVRPEFQDDTANYPTMVINSVMDGVAGSGAQFAVATGDYMFARTLDIANRQLDLLATAERRYPGYIFHALGNHECTGGTMTNCPNGTETGNIRSYRDHFLVGRDTVYYDFTIATSMGDAHFIVTAPNAWTVLQQSWLTQALARPARYTFVVAHIPPTSDPVGPGTMDIETAVRARAGAVTLRLYGHTHDYRRIAPNALIAGNAGAPLVSPTDFFGYVVVEQRADGNVDVTAYSVGSPPMVQGTWTVHPDGTSG